MSKYDNANKNITISKDSSAKYYQSNKERVQENEK